MIFVLLTVLKVLICLTGFGFCAFYFFSPAINFKDKIRLKKAGIIFLFTWLMIIVITAIEFLIIGHK